MFARLFDVPRARRRAVVADVLDLVGVADAADRLAATYSGGMVRRLELAQALVNRPRLLVLDEPTIGLDPIARGGVWERISELVAAGGMTVLVTTHYMEEADQQCDRVALMHQGAVRALGTPAELRRALAPGASLEDVFRHWTGEDLSSGEVIGNVRATRRAAAATADARAVTLAGDLSWEPFAPAPAAWRILPRRIGALCLAELQKLRHDRTEVVTRAIQPALWLLIFGETFARIRAIPTGVPYLDYLAPGILAQSALFIAIFYGIQIIWERDAGILTKLLVTPTPRAALVAGKAFAAGLRATAQVIVVLLLCLLLRVGLTANPLRWLAAEVMVLLGTAFFCCLSITIAGIVLKRDRLMGIGQAITVPCSSGATRSIRPG